MKEVNISQVDTLFVNGIYPIEILFYFKQRLETKNIRSALRKASSDFWPVFGEYADGIIHFDKYRQGECYREETFEKDFRFGLGFEISERMDYAWGGAAGTRFWVHPQKKRIVLFMTQILPYDPRSYGEQIRDIAYEQ